MTLYAKQKSIDDLANHIIGKVLDALGIDNKIYNRWC
jgi:4-hydroxy-3-polyprenylbenzoate decarboxylase